VRAARFFAVADFSFFTPHLVTCPRSAQPFPSPPPPTLLFVGGIQRTPIVIQNIHFILPPPVRLVTPHTKQIFFLLIFGVKSFSSVDHYANSPETMIPVANGVYSQQTSVLMPVFFF